MNSSPTPKPGEASTGKLWAFRILTVCLTTIVGACLAEVALRWQLRRIKESNAMAPGMVQYDAELGWKLAPGWTGRHENHDFSVSYSINPLGFRHDTPVVDGSKNNRLTVVVGDSFTFGLGVNDDATFVHRLNAERPEGKSFSNGSIPGFSTDQEALLIEKHILPLRPDEILLVVYVGNDFFDNPRRFPLQASNAKPFFELTDQGLALRNNPVPMELKPPEHGPGGLMAAIWGSDPTRWSWRTRWERQSVLFGLFSQAILPEADHRREFTIRFVPYLQLFDRILERIADDCKRNNVTLTVVTLAGQSFIESPGSVSAQYQDLFRAQVMATSAALQINAIDLASLMQLRHGLEAGKWFYPNEGHLNPAGHQVVAEIMMAELSRAE